MPNALKNNQYQYSYITTKLANDTNEKFKKTSVDKNGERNRKLNANYLYYHELIKRNSRGRKEYDMRIMKRKDLNGRR